MQPLGSPFGRPRLVATDLDGTIVRSDGSVSARTAAALARVEQAGAEFVLVTGRPPRWIHDVADQLGHRGLAICANGALWYDLRTEEVRATQAIEPEVLAEAVARLRAAIPDLSFAVEYGTGMACEDTYAVSMWDTRRDGVRRVDLETLVTRPCAKLLGRHPRLDADTLLALTAAVVGDLVTATHSSGNRLVEMSAAGVSKATALAELCATRGVAARDVVAFGDMPNDLPMLSWAGRSYAVANAHPDVLAAVTHHTRSNDEDGVAQVLERLFPLPAPRRAV